MKKTFLILSLSLGLLTQSAIASTTTCSNSSTYQVLLDSETQTAEVIQDEASLTVLACEPTGEQPQYPDQIITTHLCHEVHVVDAGYGVAIRAGGIAGLIIAELSEITIAGARPLAHLNCRR